MTDPWPYQDQAAQLRRPGEEPEPPPAVPQEPEFLIEPEPGPEEYPWQPVEQAQVETAAPVYEPPAVVPEEPEVIEEEPASVEHAAGDFRIPDGYGVIEGSPAGTRRTVGVVVSRFNGEITIDSGATPACVRVASAVSSSRFVISPLKRLTTTPTVRRVPAGEPSITP